MVFDPDFSKKVIWSYVEEWFNANQKKNADTIYSYKFWGLLFLITLPVMLFMFTLMILMQLPELGESPAQTFSS